MLDDFLQGLWWFLQQPAAAVIVAVAIAILGPLVPWYIRRHRRAAQQEQIEVSQVEFEDATVNIDPTNEAANANIEPITINVPPGATTTIGSILIRENEVQMENVVIQRGS